MIQVMYPRRLSPYLDQAITLAVHDLGGILEDKIIDDEVACLILSFPLPQLQQLFQDQFSLLSQLHTFQIGGEA
jgi:hypothetical protein